MKFLFFFGFLAAIVFAIWGSSEGKKRQIGETTGGLLGFFLGLIGLIIVMCSPRLSEQAKNEVYQEAISIPDEIKKYKELLDSGAITQEEYDTQKTRLLN